MRGVPPTRRSQPGSPGLRDIGVPCLGHRQLWPRSTVSRFRVSDPGVSSVGLGNRAAAFGVRRPGATPGLTVLVGRRAGSLARRSAHVPLLRLKVTQCPYGNPAAPSLHPQDPRLSVLPTWLGEITKNPPRPCHPQSRRDPSPAATNPRRHFATCWILRTTLQVRSSAHSESGSQVMKALSPMPGLLGRPREGQESNPGHPRPPCLLQCSSAAYS